MKRKATGWEKIFPKHISSKGHVTGIIRAIYNLFFKWGKDFGVVYQKKKKIHMNSMWLLIREIQIKTQMWYYYTSIRLPMLLNNNIKCRQKWWGTCIADRNAK